MYAEFGLDEKKVSRSRGRIEKTFYCPWTEQVNTSGGWYLCFENWVLSLPAIEQMLASDPQPVDDYATGEECVKCKGVHRHLYFTPQRVLGICASCAVDAYHYSTRPKPPPPEGTQFKLF